MIPEESIQQGRVTKLVRVPPAPLSPDGSPAHDFEGYGILRSSDGKDVFFVGIAVAPRDFARLETGTEVSFIMEPGPFLRAARVWIPPAPDINHLQISGRKPDQRQSKSPQAETAPGNSRAARRGSRP